MFALVLPIAAAIGLAGHSRLRNVGEPTAGSIHVPSVVLSAIGFGALVYGLSELGRGGRRPNAAGALHRHRSGAS